MPIYRPQREYCPTKVTQIIQYRKSRDPEERKRLRKARKHGTPYAPHGTITSLPQSLKDLLLKPDLIRSHFDTITTALKPYTQQAKARTPQQIQNIKDRWQERQNKEEKEKAQAERLFNKIVQAQDKYNSYDPKQWQKAYFDNNTGGYVVWHNKHQFGVQGGGGDAEKAVGYILAKKGKQIEFLAEGVIEGKKCPDLRFDGKTWDIKNITTNNQRTIRKAYKEATLKADTVIFYDKDGIRKESIIDALARERGNLSKQNQRIIRAYWVNKLGDWLEI